MSYCTCVRKGNLFIDRQGKAWIADPCVIPNYLPPGPKHRDYSDGPAPPTTKKKSNLKKPKKVHFDEHTAKKSESQSQSQSQSQGQSQGPIRPAGQKRRLIEVDIDLEQANNQILAMEAHNAAAQTADEHDKRRTAIPHQYNSQSFDEDDYSSDSAASSSQTRRQHPVPSEQWSRSRRGWDANKGHGMAPGTGTGTGRYCRKSTVTRTAEHTIWSESVFGACGFWDVHDEMWDFGRDGERRRRPLKSSYEDLLRFFTS